MADEQTLSPHADAPPQESVEPGSVRMGATLARKRFALHRRCATAHEQTPHHCPVHDVLLALRRMRKVSEPLHPQPCPSSQTGEDGQTGTRTRRRGRHMDRRCDRVRMSIPAEIARSDSAFILSSICRCCPSGVRSDHRLSISCPSAPRWRPGRRQGKSGSLCSRLGGRSSLYMTLPYRENW
jgi:hypothetical protein